MGVYMSMSDAMRTTSAHATTHTTRTAGNRFTLRCARWRGPASSHPNHVIREHGRYRALNIADPFLTPIGKWGEIADYEFRRSKALDPPC